MKIKALIAALIAVLMLAACGEKKAELPEGKVDNKVQTQDNISERESVNSADEKAAMEQTVSGMLGCFSTLNYEGAMEYIQEKDRALFSLDNTSQKTLYDTLFAKLKYEIADCYILEGRSYTEVKISAPDMLDVYGELNLRYIDAMMNGEITNEEESRDFNNKALVEIVEAGDIDYKETAVPVELVKEDGAFKVVFTAEIMNAMLGDIQTAQQQVSDAIEEGMTEYNSAVEDGQ